MRGHGESNGGLWYTIDLEELIERDHPLRAIKRMVDEALRGMDRDFRAAYPRNGLPSVAPERLLKALLLQSLYTIRSERELCRRLKTDLLFRLFLDMTPDEDVLVPTVFTHNRERLTEHGLTQRFFDGVVRQAVPAVQSMQRKRGHLMSRRRRKVVEEFFGWAKTIAGLRRSRHVGRWKMKQQLELTAAAYTLVRMRRLLAA